MVTGCARSGTTYTADVLRSAGVAAGHERVLTSDGVQDEPHPLDVTCFAPPHLPLAGVLVVHQLRTPLDVIASLVGRAMVTRRQPGSFWPFVTRHLPEADEYLEWAQRAACYWLRWNAWAAAHADYTWRVHDLAAADVFTAARQADVPVAATAVDHALAVTPQDTGGSTPEPVALRDLGPLAGSVRRAADSYRLPLTSKG